MSVAMSEQQEFRAGFLRLLFAASGFRCHLTNVWNHQTPCFYSSPRSSIAKISLLFDHLLLFGCAVNLTRPCMTPVAGVATPVLFPVPDTWASVRSTVIPIDASSIRFRE
jgi:hypothetical protein